MKLFFINNLIIYQLTLFSRHPKIIKMMTYEKKMNE